MTDELRIAGQPNPLDEFRFPWAMGTFDVYKIAGQPNGIDMLKIASTLTDDECLRVVSNNNTEDIKNKSKVYNDYFDDMEIEDEEVDERVDTAEELEKSFLFLFALLLLLKKENIPFNEEVIAELLIYRLKEAMKRLGIDIRIVERYIETFVPKVVESTLKNFSNPYTTTEDRAVNLAKNESNSIRNTIEFNKAVKKGYKHKIWHTQRDERVRQHHREVDDIKIGINDKFVVGDCLMLYPHDTVNGDSQEVANCRCVCEYVK